MTYLINESFAAGAFPDQLETARVTPIFKNPSNYRSISSFGYMLTNFETCPKIVSVIIYLNMSYLLNNSLDFLEEISTSHVLNHLTEFIY